MLVLLVIRTHLTT